MDFSKFDEFLKEMPERGIPMCELAISKDGKVVYRASVGYSDAERTKPVSNRDIYWIFSATKVITCTAAMRLVSEGKIVLTDPVSKYIPEFANITVRQSDGSVMPAKNIMTVEHLFTMTGGLTYDIRTPELQYAKRAGLSTLDTIRQMAKTPLAFEPGTRYCYSLCHDVLAAVVEVASGMRFSEYLDKYIFRPLGIVDMGFHPSEEQKSRFATQYTYKNGTGIAVPKPVNNVYILTSDYDSGGAGLFATVDEYIKIIAALSNGGRSVDGYRLLAPEYLEMMKVNRLQGDVLNSFVTSKHFGYGFGYGCRVHINPKHSLGLSPVGEFGWDGAAGAFALVDTENRLAMYFGTHVLDCGLTSHILHYRLRDMLYSKD